MRVVKEAEERRNEILDAAEALFSAKGFDNTSTNDILEQVGIARGTLYYHFRSKEEILDGVIDRAIDGAIVKAASIMKNEEIPFMNRLTAGILSLHLPKGSVREQMHHPQNALMHQKTQQRLISGVVPILSEWCGEGVRRGLLHLEYPAVAAEMLILYSGVMFDDDTEQSPEEKRARIQGFIYHAERILGAEPGVIAGAIREIFERNGEA